MKMKNSAGILVLALALAASSFGEANVASAQARSFSVQRSRVTFTSDAPLETIVGRSTSASGSLNIDPANPSSARGTITVPVTSLRTQNELRDEHLHSARWLNAPAHPNATFEITGVRGASSLTANQDVNLQVTGRFTIHGVTRDVTARIRAKWDGGSTIRARAQFTIRLSDFSVEIPAIVQAKVSNEIAVQLDLRLST